MAFFAAFIFALLLPQWMPTHHFNSVLQAIAYIPATLLIYYGYRLSLRTATDVRQHDARPPILYLRSFGLDERNNLNPPGFIAQSLGLEPPWLLRWLGPVGNIYPIRLVRLFFSRAADHAEEQLADFFQRLGPFVAIGRPGDRLAIGGAARVYLHDSDWRAAVQKLMDEAAFIVIQPDDTEQIWWEIRETLQRIRLGNVLFLLLIRAGAQWKYERFRLRFERETGRTLPRALGDGVFLHFTPEGAQLLPVRHLPHVAWPVAGCSVDFPRTLAPFLAAREGRTAPIAPAPRPWMRRASAAFGLLAWVWVIGLVYFAAGLPVTKLRAKIEAQTMARAAFTGAGATVQQGPPATPYRLTLPGGWQPQKIELPLSARIMGLDRFLRLWTWRDSALCLIQVEPAGESVVKDSREYRDRVIGDLRREARSVEILGEQEETSDGRTWLTTHLRVRGGGGLFTQQGLSKGVFFLRDADLRIALRTYVGPHGFMQIRTGANTGIAPILDPALEQIFRSFHYDTPAQVAERARRQAVAEVLAETRRETFTGTVGDFEYRLELPPPWRRTSVSYYEFAEHLVIGVLSIAPATSPPAGRTPLRALQDDFMERLRKDAGEVRDLRETEIQHDGRTWLEAQFEVPGNGNYPLVHQWLAIDPGRGGGLVFRVMSQRHTTEEMRPVIRQAFAGLHLVTLRDREAQRARPLVPGVRRITLPGRALPYSLTLDAKWQQDPPTEPFDISAQLGGEVGAGVALEDLRHVPVQPTPTEYTTAILDNIRRSADSTFAVEERGAVELAGVKWERVRYRVTIQGTRLQYTACFTAQRGVGFRLVGWSGFETPEVHDSLVEPVFRGFKLPP